MRLNSRAAIRSKEDVGAAHAHRKEGSAYEPNRGQDQPHLRAHSTHGLGRTHYASLRASRPLGRRLPTRLLGGPAGAHRIAAG